MTDINELGAAFMSGFKVGDKIISMDAQGLVRLIFLYQSERCEMGSLEPFRYPLNELELVRTGQNGRRNLNQNTFRFIKEAES